MKSKLLFLLQVLLFAGLHFTGAQDNKFTIRGMVTDENGSPLAGAGITVVNTGLGAYSGADGSYMIGVKHAGIFRVRFSFTGYDPVIKEISVPTTLILDARLFPRVSMTEEVIVSATRAGSKTPVAYTNVTNDEISRANTGADLPYLIALTPSVVETSEAGTGIGYTSLRIRGTDGSRINITLDGIPLNDAESQQVFWVDLPDLASSVDNIQVQRGAGTSSNGAGAFGASVNILTKNPDNDPFAEVSTTAGSYNTLKNTVIAGTGLLSKRFALQMRYSDIHSDGYIKRTGVDNKSGYVSGVYKTGSSILRANVILGEEHTGISWWGVPGDILDSDRRYNPAGEYTDESGVTKYYDNETDNYRQNHYQLIFGTSLSPELTIQAALHYTRGKGYYEEYREDQAFSDYGLPAVTIGTSLITSSDLIRRKWMSNDFYGAVYSLTLKKGKTDLVFGGSANIYDGDHYGRIIWMQLAGNATKDFQWYLNNGRKAEAGIFGKVSYRFGERLTGFGDIQYRHISYRMSGPDDDLKDLSQEHFFNFLNPRAGLFWSVKPNQDLYLSFSVAHKEPTRADFKEASGDRNATPRAEALFDSEGGYNLKTSPADLGINIYGMFYRDQLVPTGELSNVGYPIMTNVRDSYRAGIEISALLRLSQFMNWNLNTTFSRNKILDFTEYYTDYNTSDWSSRYLSRNLGKVDIAFSPAVTGSSDLIFIISEALKIHLLSKFVGKQYFDNTMSSDRRLDPYFVNNVRFDLDPPARKIKGVEIQLLLNNILNSKYENNAYGGNWFEDGVEKTWAYYFPQAGFNFLAKLNVKF